MVTTTYTGGFFQDWNDPTYWTAGIPVSEDTAVIGQFLIETSNLGLSNLTVQLTESELEGNVLTLANTTIDTFSRFDPLYDQYAVSAISQSELVSNKMSFIGFTPNIRNGGVNIFVDTFRNNGTLAAESGADGGGWGVSPKASSSRSAFINNGQAIVSNSAHGYLKNTDVTGTGTIAISNSGTLTLDHSTVAASEKLDLGGEGATTVAYDPSQSNISATISGFGITDVIDLNEFLGTLTVSGTKNPVLHINGNADSTPVSFDLAFKGNYKGDIFSMLSDGKGGSLLMVDQT